MKKLVDRYKILAIVFVVGLSTFTTNGKATFLSDLKNEQSPRQNSILDDSIIISVHTGWNLISIPIDVGNSTTSSLFPSAISPAFIYTHYSYQPTGAVQYGKAFWLKFASSETITIAGKKRFEDELNLDPGWNLVAGTRLPTATSSLILSSDSLLQTGFIGNSHSCNYTACDTLQPTNGYWVKAAKKGCARTTKWEFLGLAGERINAITFHPNNPDIMYAASGRDFSSSTEGKIFKSTNGGHTWDTLAVGGSYVQIELDPLHPDTIYATPGGIIRSTDGGTTWQQRDSGIVVSSDIRVQSIAIHQTMDSILYAASCASMPGNFFKSTNGGQSWFVVTKNPSLINEVILLRFDPQNPMIMYAGLAWTGNLLKSTDAGNTWFNTGFPVRGKYIYDILINPDRTNEIYIATEDTAFFKSTDAGATWVTYDEGLPRTIAPYPTLPDTTVSGIKLAIDTNENLLFGYVYQSGPRIGLYVRDTYDSAWKTKISLSTINLGGSVALNLVPQQGIIYLGANGIYRLRYR